MECGKYNVIKRKDSGNIIFFKEGIMCGEVIDYYGVDQKKAEEIYYKLINTDKSVREATFEQWINDNATCNRISDTDEEDTPAEPKPEPTLQEMVTDAIQRMINFFSEFDFTPSFRFINTLIRVGKKEAKDYICNYFALMSSPYAEEIRNKVKSKEFEAIIKDFFGAKSTQTINTRFRIYYGAQGTGKTTLALTESDNKCIVCNSSMLPCDLMEDFTFDDGKATFHPSALAKCMEDGKTIVLDEINLLPFDSLRFLQGIFDGKKEFLYKGQTIHIADGFKVIGTMNLTINGMAYGLPEPLVDRCEVIHEFKLDASSLYGAL